MSEERKHGEKVKEEKKRKLEQEKKMKEAKEKKEKEEKMKAEKLKAKRRAQEESEAVSIYYLVCLYEVCKDLLFALLYHLTCLVILSTIEKDQRRR